MTIIKEDGLGNKQESHVSNGGEQLYVALDNYRPVVKTLPWMQESLW